jgi:RND family efflux transporter MFP subunit
MKPLFKTLIIATGLLLGQSAMALSGIESEEAHFKEVSSSYMLDGIVEAELSTTISAQTSGLVKDVRFDVDDFVKKNQIVVLIDDTQQKASYQQALAAEKEARARLNEAQLEYDRVKKVYAKKVVPKATFDKAAAGLASAKARLDSARAARAKAKESLDYTRVRAPFSGVLTKRWVEKGERVNVGSQLVSGVSLERLRVRTHVPQSIFQAVRDHKYAIVVTADSEIVSRDMTFFPFADPLSHSFELRVRIPLTETSLRPGMFVKVAMEVSREHKVVIPFNSVAFRGEVTGVYVLEDDKLHFRHVRLGRRLADNEVVVLAGVNVGDQVVTDPVAAAIKIKQAQTK